MTQIPLGVLFYTWYGFDRSTGESIGGIGSTHWNQDKDHSGVVYVPEFGFYASDNPDVIARQIGAMRKAGITWALVSWFGWGDVDLDDVIENLEFAAIERAVQAVFNYVSTQAKDFKLAILIEPFMDPINGGPIPAENLTLQQKQQILDYVWSNYYSSYSSVVFKWQGKPLLVCWGPPDAPLSFKDVGDERFTHRVWGDSAPESDWNFFPYLGLQGIQSSIAADGQVWITPRYDEFYEWIMGHPAVAGKAVDELIRIDPALEEGFYDQAWKILFDKRDRIRLIIIYAWNQYGEQAFLEPASIGPYPPGWTLIEKTAHYYHRLTSGLPYELYSR